MECRFILAVSTHAWCTCVSAVSLSYPPVTAHGSSLPSGQQFMIDLLVNSLMVDQGLENALLTAIAYEVQDPAAVLKVAEMESSVPLIQLLQQLIGNSTARQLSFLKQVKYVS